MADPAKAGQKQAGRFQKGQSGNPAGKPKGARHRLTRIAERLMEDDAAEVVQEVIAKAKGGDMTAARLVLDRILPAQRSRTVQFKLPALANAADLVGAIGSILSAVAAGELTPDEASDVAGLLEMKRKAIETADMEARVSALEKKGQANGH
jgi:uncharacterized protein DUF5681